MKERSHLLMIAYYFPPLGMGGVQRPLKLAKYLPEFGWDVSVITAAHAGYLAHDESLAADLPPQVAVRAVTIRDPGRWLRARHQRRLVSRQPHQLLRPWQRRLQQMARWPDDKFGFVRPAVRLASRLKATRPYDVILTTSPPPSSHRVGLQLQHKHRVPWVADFRDPWLVRIGDWGPTQLHQRYAKNLRNQIVRRADVVIATNNAIADELSSPIPKPPVEVIPNGFDEADFSLTLAKKTSESVFEVLFYGTLAPTVDPTPALELLSRWRKENPERRLRIIHVGLAVGIDTAAIAREHGFESDFVSAGYIPHKEAVAKLMATDLVIIPLTTETGYEATVPGRLFEAVRSLRPILLLASRDSEASRILENVKGTWSVSPSDFERGIAALDTIADLPRVPVRDLQSIARFDRREQAKQVATLLTRLRQNQRDGYPLSAASPTDVGVIIVTYNSADEIAACLESVIAASRSPLSIAVIDNASDDNTVGIIECSYPDVCLVKNNRNRYYAAANNQGVDRVGGRHILLLNPDVVLPVGSIDALAAILNSNSSYAAVAPQLVGPDGRRQASLREFPGLDTLWFDLLGLSFLFPRSPTFSRWRMGYFDGQTERDVPQPMASCLMIRRRVIAEIGLFDERYPMFFNDVDWCRRVHEKGWNIRYIPDVRVRHAGGTATRRRKIRMIWMSHAAFFRYLRQYCSAPFWRTIAVWLSGPFLVLAACVRSLWWGVRHLFGQ